MASLEQLPTISIVVPSYNQGHFLTETLESILRQQYPKLEIIVMDGGSSDQSVEIIRSYAPHLSYWQSQPDGGQAAAIEDGVAHAHGELVAWLNSDDFYWGDALWTVGRAYAAHPEQALYIGNGLRYNQREDRYAPFCTRHLALNREALLQGLDYILQPATFFLRRAWHEVGGLNRELRYCMDWDIILRLAARYPAVLINEFLAVSREYEATKTSSGRMGRAFEIARMIQSHTRQETTPGSMFYLLETLLDVTNGDAPAELRHHLYEGMNQIRQQFVARYGNNDGFPSEGDAQDVVYLPIARADVPARPHAEADLPTISVVTPSFNQAQFLGQTLESLLSQNYPHLETLVFDAGSRDGSVEVLRSYSERLSSWVSRPDKGPADAINQGFAQATGEILGWLNSDDMLSADALWQVGQAFAADPELDLVYGNALYINEHNQLFIADHGTHRTGLYYGEMQPLERIPAYWSYVHAVPQPTVFFRRRLLETCGALDESYHFIFDFELFWRFMWKAKIKKLERTQAFYRIHAAAKTSSWNKFLIELYRYSRPWWPQRRAPAFRHTLRDFTASYMRRTYGQRPRDAWWWATAGLVAGMAASNVGNPEALHIRLPAPRAPRQPAPPLVEAAPPVEPAPAPPAQYAIDRSRQRYRSLFCSYLLPRHPGHSGGEIRDFHLLRHLLELSSVEFFAIHTAPPTDQQDVLAAALNALHSPERTQATRPELVQLGELQRTLKSRMARTLRSRNLPVLGPRYHSDVAEQFPYVLAYTRAALQEALLQAPDFLFVSPQTNPVALKLASAGLPTRLIMASYDVEALRMQRFSRLFQGLSRAAVDIEARRAASFERENLAHYDGIIAVSELDRQLFIREYGFAPERVLTINNGVDIHYFRFVERRQGRPPQIIFVGALNYLPNQQAAWRLLDQIMPLVWQRYPGASLWLVGQNPPNALLARHDGQRVVVSGKVEDVRPYLENATIACVALSTGSGTKYKVLEALSAGVPMVCTPIAAEGLAIEDGAQALIREHDNDLAQAIVRLADDPQFARQLAYQGRTLVEGQYAWDVSMARLDAWLDTMAALPRRTEEASTALPEEATAAAS